METSTNSFPSNTVTVLSMDASWILIQRHFGEHWIKDAADYAEEAVRYARNLARDAGDNQTYHVVFNHRDAIRIFTVKYCARLVQCRIFPHLTRNTLTVKKNYRY